jgi:hypothetical protein
MIAITAFAVQEVVLSRVSLVKPLLQVSEVSKLISLGPPNYHP